MDELKIKSKWLELLRNRFLSTLKKLTLHAKNKE